MNNYIELDSTCYWHDKALKEIKDYRRQKGREAAAAMAMLATCLSLAFIGFYVFSQGWLHDLDVVGGVNFARDVITTAAFNVSDFFRNLK